MMPQEVMVALMMACDVGFELKRIADFNSSAFIQAAQGLVEVMPFCFMVCSGLLRPKMC